LAQILEFGLSFYLVKKEKINGPVENVEKSRRCQARLFQAAVEIHVLRGFLRTRHFPAGQSSSWIRTDNGQNPAHQAEYRYPSQLWLWPKAAVV
jgi:hypothetical protein